MCWIKLNGLRKTSVFLLVSFSLLLVRKSVLDEDNISYIVHQTEWTECLSNSSPLWRKAEYRVRIPERMLRLPLWLRRRYRPELRPRLCLHRLFLFTYTGFSICPWFVFGFSVLWESRKRYKVGHDENIFTWKVQEEAIQWGMRGGGRKRQRKREGHWEREKRIFSDWKGFLQIRKTFLLKLFWLIEFASAD